MLVALGATGPSVVFLIQHEKGALAFCSLRGIASAEERSVYSDGAERSFSVPTRRGSALAASILPVSVYGDGLRIFTCLPYGTAEGT